jgi:hypothetical protein
LTAAVVTSFFIDSVWEKYLWLVLCTIAQLRTVVRSRPEPIQLTYDTPARVVPRAARSALP